MISLTLPLGKALDQGDQDQSSCPCLVLSPNLPWTYHHDVLCSLLVHGKAGRRLQWTHILLGTCTQEGPLCFLSKTNMFLLSSNLRDIPVMECKSQALLHILSASLYPSKTMTLDMTCSLHCPHTTAYIAQWLSWRCFLHSVHLQSQWFQFFVLVSISKSMISLSIYWFHFLL